MICVVCRQAETVHGLTTVHFERGEFRLLVKSVPAQTCPSCDETYVEEEVAKQLLLIAGQISEFGILDTQCEYSALRI
jgi:YgiT-type zinc finger domain-containing protein